MEFTTHFELHSQTTRLFEGCSHGSADRSYTGLSPSKALRSRRLGPKHRRTFLYKLQLGPKPDFKFELMPLHSPLLGQSLLVSFPPLIDMLKFSGYPYLIRGQPEKIGGCWQARTRVSKARRITTLEAEWHRH